jgi:hypothetical protein
MHARLLGAIRLSMAQPLDAAAFAVVGSLPRKQSTVDASVIDCKSAAFSAFSREMRSDAW